MKNFILALLLVFGFVAFADAQYVQKGLPKNPKFDSVSIGTAHLRVSGGKLQYSNDGTNWYDVGSGGEPFPVVEQADCSTITAGICKNTSTGAIYYWNGSAVATLIDSVSLNDGQVAWKDPGDHAIKGKYLPLLIASGSVAFNPPSIASGACSSAVDGGTATGVLTSDVINWIFSGDPTAVTGYAASATGGVYIVAYPTADHVNFKACNNTAGAIDPGSVTLNWQVVR